MHIVIAQPSADGPQSPKDFKTYRRSLFALVCTLAVWLHLTCNLSRTRTNQALRAVEFIFLMAIGLGRMFAQAEDPPSADSQAITPPPLRLPHDVHTAITALSLNL